MLAVDSNYTASLPAVPGHASEARGLELNVSNEIDGLLTVKAAIARYNLTDLLESERSADASWRPPSW